jgi:hypothetical protein
MRIFLSAYTIRIKFRKDAKHSEDSILSKFNGHDDFRDVLKSFLEDLSSSPKNKAYKTYLKAANIQSNDRNIEGILESGSYGLSSTIRDVDTNEVKYKKNTNDADVLPFYFVAYIPKDTNEGIIILQRTGKHGIKTNFGISLNSYFSKNYSGYSVEINTLIQEGLIKKILYNGTIKKIRCVQYKAHIDAIDGLDDGHKESPYNMEIVLSGNKIPFMNKIKEFFSSPNNNIKTLVELRDFRDFDYDTVKVDIEENDSIKTFDLSDLYKAKAYYDISSEVTLDNDGHPIFSSIKAIAKKHLDETIKQIYLTEGYSRTVSSVLLPKAESPSRKES